MSCIKISTIFLGIVFLISSQAQALLFGSNSLDPRFCELNAVRQTVVYVDELMMVDGKTDWATKIAQKLKASLMPGERVTVVRLLTTSGRSNELWSGCWPNYPNDQIAKLRNETFLLRANPLDALGNQQKFFLRDFGTALTAIYLSAKRPESQARFHTDKPPEKQILRALTSDDGRFANSTVTIRVIVYSDMAENSDLGSAFVTSTGEPPNYAEKLGSRLRKSVFYAFGVGEYVRGRPMLETAKAYWTMALKSLSATVGGLGAELNVPNQLPTKAFGYDLILKFDNQDLDGKMSIMTDDDGNVVDSWIGFSRLSIAGLTGTFRCKADICTLDGSTTSGLTTTSPSEFVLLTGGTSELTGSLGVKGTKDTFSLKASASRN